MRTKAATIKTMTTAYDPAEFLRTPKARAEYLNAVMEEGDPGEVIRAIGVVARAAGMSEVATGAKVTRPSLYKAYREGGNPGFGTVLKTFRALGLRVAVAAPAAKKTAGRKAVAPATKRAKSRRSAAAPARA